MSFEYLVSAPQSVITFPAILLMITSGLGSGFLALWAVGLWAEDETKASAFSLIAAICLSVWRLLFTACSFGLPQHQIMKQ